MCDNLSREALVSDMSERDPSRHSRSAMSRVVHKNRTESALIGMAFLASKKNASQMFAFCGLSCYFIRVAI